MLCARVRNIVYVEIEIDGDDESCGVVAAVAMRMCRSARKSENGPDHESFWMMC